MKKLLLLASIAGLVIGSSQAATTVTLTNFAAGVPFTGLVITDVTGAATPFTVSVGYDIGGGFIANGSSNNIATATWTTTISDASALAGNAWLDSAILVSITTSEGTMLFDTGSVWTVEDPLLGGNASSNIAQDTQLGDYTDTTVNPALTGPFAPITNGVSAVVVPEPSSLVLLGGLGLLGFVRRRR